METAAIATVVKMMEPLPESMQEQVAQHLREYLFDLRDEQQWDEQFRRTQPQLVAASRRAREEIAAGRAEPLDLHRL